MTNRTTKIRTDLTADRVANYDRALAAERRLRAAVAVVDALCALVRTTDRMCSGCVWETIVKPMILPLVGWERGYPPRQAKDPGPRPAGLHLTRADLGNLPRPVTASTETETWLRSMEAWDAVTGTLLDRLYQADPGNGHGVCRTSGDAA